MAFGKKGRRPDLRASPFFRQKCFFNFPEIFHLKEAQVLSAHVGPQATGDDHAQHHHDLLSPGLRLVLEGLLGVVGGSRRVLDGAFDVGVYSVDHLALEVKKGLGLTAGADVGIVVWTPRKKS